MRRPGVIVCVQCSMRTLLKGESSPVFDETLEAHMARCHPDLAATQQERKGLEQKLAEKFKCEL
jgi:hypothetical protein